MLSVEGTLIARE